MTDVRQRSRSMTAFADTHGPPDAETTARMRERLQTSLRDHDSRRGRLRTWIVASLVTAIVVAGAGWGAWRVGWIGAAPEGLARGVIGAGDHPLELEHDWGEVVLAAHTLVRLDERGDTTEIELVDGEIELRSGDATPVPVSVRVGAYEIAGESARFSVRRTPGVPLVTVFVGRVRLEGPGLPDAGVTMAAPEAD